LVRRFCGAQDLAAKHAVGDDIREQEVWSSRRFDLLKDYVSGYDTVVIDEAQRIPDIGMSLNTLTGRKVSLQLHPLSHIELGETANTFELREELPTYLRFGSYPEVLSMEFELQKRELLREIMGSYLLKDILELQRVKSSKVLLDLLRLVAFQIGSEVSHHELATQLEIDSKTVARYQGVSEMP